MTSLVPAEIIEKKILLIRGQKVILDFDLADLYGVPTKALKQSVKRNIKRFPSDFMFSLIYQEVRNLRSQFVTSSSPNWGGTRFSPMAFSEQGVAMLSSVLNSERAIEINILIMRAFVKLREMIASNKDLARRLDELENKYEKQFKIVFEAIRQLGRRYLVRSPKTLLILQSLRRAGAFSLQPVIKIGFDLKEKQVGYRKKKIK